MKYEKNGNFLNSEYKFLKIKIWKLIFFFKLHHLKIYNLGNLNCQYFKKKIEHIIFRFFPRTFFLFFQKLFSCSFTKKIEKLISDYIIFKKIIYFKLYNKRNFRKLFLFIFLQIFNFFSSYF